MLTLISIPYFTAIGENGEKHDVLYYNMATRETITLEPFTVDDISLGASLFKYSYTADTQQLITYLDYTSGGVASEGKLTIKAELLSLDGEVVTEGFVSSISSPLITSYTCEEGIYVQHLAYTLGDATGDFYKLIIASECMDAFYNDYARYDKIPLNKWLEAAASIDATILSEEVVNQKLEGAAWIGCSNNVPEYTHILDPIYKPSFTKKPSLPDYEGTYEEENSVEAEVNYDIKDKYFTNAVKKYFCDGTMTEGGEMLMTLNESVNFTRTLTIPQADTQVITYAEEAKEAFKDSNIYIAKIKHVLGSENHMTFRLERGLDNDYKEVLVDKDVLRISEKDDYQLQEYLKKYCFPDNKPAFVL